MSEEVIKILDDLAERFGIAINWADKNVMPYLQELFDKFINWEMWTSVMYGGIGLICVIIGVVIVIALTRGFKKRYSELDGDMWFIIIFCSGIFFLGGGALVFAQLYDIIECLTFPEKTLFDYLTYQMDNN